MTTAISRPKSDISTRALAEAITDRTRALCATIELGTGGIFDLVTPTTAELLRWWFERRRVAARGQLNFHPHQRQAILNTIVAQEIVAAPSLRELYLHAAPEALLTQAKRIAADEARNNHPRYCLAMPASADQTLVSLALTIWQFLNRKAAAAAGWTDARFVHNFLVLAPDPAAYQRLLAAFFGHSPSGSRHFTRSAVAQAADLLIPLPLRHRVLSFMRTNTWSQEEIGPYTGEGLIAICEARFFSGALVGQAHAPTEPALATHGTFTTSPAVDTKRNEATERLQRRSTDAARHLAALPELMVLNQAGVPLSVVASADTTSERWSEGLQAIAARKGQRFVEVDLAIAAGTNEECSHPHTIFRPLASAQG
jgi:type III restriction enzyme